MRNTFELHAGCMQAQAESAGVPMCVWERDRERKERERIKGEMEKKRLGEIIEREKKEGDSARIRERES